MFSSLRFRLWLTYTLVILVLIAIASSVVVFYLLGNPAASRLELQRLRLSSTIINKRIDEIQIKQSSYPIQRLETVVKRGGETVKARIAVFDKEGELLVDSQKESESAIPPLAKFQDRRPGAPPVIRDLERKVWLFNLKQLKGGNSLVLMAPRPKTPVVAIFRDEFLSPFVRAAGVVLIISLVFSFWIARWVAAPLQKISNETAKVSVGEFQPIPLEGPDEVKALANSFNEMGVQVQASQHAQRDFIANVSHDLKTHITSIQGFAQAIMDGTVKESNAVKGAAGVIYTEAGRMHRMVTDLLELARLDSGMVNFRRDRINLNEILHGVVKNFFPIAKETQVDITELYSTVPTVTGDGDRLAQVFSNLMDNAIKFTPSGGGVTVFSSLNDSWVEILFSDSGPGIPNSELDRVFERFYQTDKSRHGGITRGIGLGLAIANEINQAHGGTITAHNRDEVDINLVVSADSGSVFIVRLPINGVVQ
ncbi:ATP-binding protein [Chloroflexota bacterium]